jgi:glycerophosphoryl diester phosphodiesterase
VTHPLSPADRLCPPLVFAHRGGRALAPENTLAALDLGLAAGADGLEFDVRISSDGVPVLHHDPDLDRCTNGRGPVEALTAAELTRIDAAYWFDAASGYPLRGHGIGVPTLAGALERHAGPPLIVEIKVDAADAARRVLEVIRRAGALHRVCIGSFSLQVLQTVRALEPRLPTSAARKEGQWSLYRSWLGLPLGNTPYRGFQVPERAGRLKVVSRRFIRAAHRSGLPVQVWTVNDERDMWRLLDWGADALISDRPDLAARVRDAWVALRGAAPR